MFVGDEIGGIREPRGRSPGLHASLHIKRLRDMKGYFHDHTIGRLLRIREHHTVISMILIEDIVYSIGGSGTFVPSGMAEMAGVRSLFVPRITRDGGRGLVRETEMPLY